MHISEKSVKIIYWLITLSILFGFFLASQSNPETSGWRFDTLVVTYYIVSIALYIYTTKLFWNITVAPSASYKPRFNSKIKTQLWGLLNRIGAGVLGYVTLTVFFELPPGSILYVNIIYGLVVIGGFINDGKRYDKYVVDSA